MCFCQFLRSPAYEAIITEQSEDLLLKSPSPPSKKRMLIDESESKTIETETTVVSEPIPDETTSQELSDSHQNVCQTVEPVLLRDEHESVEAMEEPGLSSNKTLASIENSDISPTKPSGASSLVRHTRSLLAFETLSQNMDSESIGMTLQTCTNEFLRNFYEYCTMDRQCFNDHFPMIAKEMGTRQMTELIMGATRVCESLQTLSHYKCIVDALILAGFQKKVSVKYLCDNHVASSHETPDILIDIILDHDCAHDMLEYLEKFARQKKHSFQNSLLERLLPVAIKTGWNKRWIDLVTDIICNSTSRRALLQCNAELRKQTIKWLQCGKEEKTASEPKQQETWTRTIVNNRYVKTSKALPDLVRIITPK